MEHILQQVAIKKLIVRNYEAEQRNEATAGSDGASVGDRPKEGGEAAAALLNESNSTESSYQSKIRLPFKGLYVRQEALAQPQMR